MSVIGITGSRAGCTPAQYACLASYLRHPTTTVVHHGDCVGVDAEAHTIAGEAGKAIVVHPPTDTKLRAWMTGSIHKPATTFLPAPYIERNHAIVDACDRLLAVVAQPEATQPRSGTWATVRYAVRTGKPVTIIWPDGRRETR